MAVTLGVNTASTTDGVSYTTGSFTPAADDALIVVVFKTVQQTAGDISDTGQSLGWTNILSQTSGSGLIEAFRADALAAAVATTVTYSWATGNATSCDIAVFRASGVDAAADIRQILMATGTGPSTPAVTLTNAALTNNQLIGFVKNAQNPAALSPPSSWTEDADTGVSTPSAGYECCHRNSGETGSTITWGSSSTSNWTALVAEFWTTIHAALDQALALTLSAASSVQVTGALSAALAFGFSSASSAQVTVAMNQAVPLSVSASGSVQVTGTLSKSVTFPLSTTGSVQVTGALSNALPFTLSADGSTATTVYATLNQAVPVSLITAGAVQVTGAVSKAVPLSFTAAGTTTNAIQCALNLPVPFATRKYLPNPTTTMPTGVTVNRLVDPLYHSPFEGTVYESDGPFPGDGTVGVDYTLVARITTQSGASLAFRNALTASATVANPVIEVNPGIALTGPFVWPVNTGGPGGTATWLEVRTTAYASLTPRGTMFDDALDAPLSFIILNQNIVNGEAFHFAPGFKKLRLRGCLGRLNTGAGKSTACWGRIALGETSLPGALSDRPTEIVLDKCDISADDTTTDARAGLWLTCDQLALYDTKLLKWHRSGAEAKAITAPYGATRVKCINVWMQAAGEAWFHGGVQLPNDDPAWLCADWEMRRIRTWSYPVPPPTPNPQGYVWDSKNLGETKGVERMLIDGWKVQYHYEDGQNPAVVLKNVHQTAGSIQGSQYNRSNHHTIWFLECSDIPAFLVIVGKEIYNPPLTLDEPLHHVDLRFVRVWDINKPPYDTLAEETFPGSGVYVKNPGGRNLMIIGNGAENIVVDHLTIAGGPNGIGHLLYLSQGNSPGNAITNFRLTNSIMPQTQYGIWADSLAEGNGALTVVNGTKVFSKVVLYRHAGASTATTYPSGFEFVATESVVLPNTSTNDHTPAAAYIGTATDGLDYGAMPEWVAARVTGATTPTTHTFLTKAVPLSLTATASVQVTGALNKPVALPLTATASVQATAALNKAVPASLSATGTVLSNITAALAQAVPFSLTATGSVQVDAALSKALPLTLVASGTAANTVYGGVDQAVPLTLAATTSVQVTGALTQAVPLVLATEASVQITASVDTALPFTFAAAGQTQIVDVEHLRFTDSGSIQPLFTDVSDLGYRFTDVSAARYRFTDTSQG